MKFSYPKYISLQFYLCSNFLRYNKNKVRYYLKRIKAE